MPDLTQPTQVRYSSRSVVRTILQTIVPAAIALGFVVPEVVEVVLDAAGESMPDNLRAILLGISAVVAATAGAIARIMAIPKVEAFLRSGRFTRWMAAEPRPVPPVDVDPSAGNPPTMDAPYDGPAQDYQPLIARHLYASDPKSDAAHHDGT